MGACYCTGKCRETGVCPNTPYPIPIAPQRQGWTCGKCGRSNAPWVATCPCSLLTFTITYGAGWPD